MSALQLAIKLALHGDECSHGGGCLFVKTRRCNATWFQVFFLSLVIETHPDIHDWELSCIESMCRNGYYNHQYFESQALSHKRIYVQ